MIHFIIPVIAQATALDWATVTATLSRTIKSIEKQSSDNYKVWIAGHEPPPLAFTTKIEFIAVDYAPLGRDADQILKTLDAACKVARATQALANQVSKTCRIMRLDSDDILRRDFVEQISNRELKSPLILDSGYIWPYNSKWLQYRAKQFANHCGSTMVFGADMFVRYIDSFPEFFDPPQKIDAASHLREIPLDHHRLLMHALANGGTKIQNKPLIVYTIGHANNLIDRKIGLRHLVRNPRKMRQKLGFSILNIRHVRPINPHIKQQFPAMIE